MRTNFGKGGKQIWTDSVPTKYVPDDLDWVDLLAKRTGLGRAEIIRRSVRLLATEASKNPKWNWIEATAQPMEPLPAELKAEIAKPENFPNAAASLKDKARSSGRAKSRESSGSSRG